MLPQKQPDKRPNTSEFCTRVPHRYWVAEVVGVEAEGRVTVILACTDCGDVKFVSEKVCEPFSGLRLTQEEKQKAKP